MLFSPIWITIYSIFKVQIFQSESRWPYFVYPFPLLNGQALHQPSVLLYAQLSYFFCGSWPLKLPICQPLVQKQKTVSFIDQRLYAVAAPPAKQKNASFFAWIQMKCSGHRCYESVYAPA